MPIKLKLGKQFFTVFSFFWLVSLSAQDSVRQFKKEAFTEARYSIYEKNKKIPLELRKQALIALSFYPELRDTKIIFRLKKRKTPLTSRPRISNVFRGKKNRTYVITVSSQTKDYLAPILFSRLPYNAQIGVLGHEVGHIVEYKTKSSLQLIGLSFKLFNDDFVDTFEFNTDKRTIEHGLGYQLLDWSIFVRQALGIAVWKGASEELSVGNKPEATQRYMNPKTVEKYISLHKIYSILNNN